MLAHPFTSPSIFRRLTSADRPAYARHLKSLSRSDRRARFHGEYPDRSIDVRSEEINFSASLVIGCFLQDELVGIVEICPSSQDGLAAELAMSVDARVRHRGIASELTRLAIVEAGRIGIVMIMIWSHDDSHAVLRIADRFRLIVMQDHDPEAGRGHDDRLSHASAMA